MATFVLVVPSRTRRTTTLYFHSIYYYLLRIIQNNTLRNGTIRWVIVVVVLVVFLPWTIVLVVRFRMLVLVLLVVPPVIVVVRFVGIVLCFLVVVRVLCGVSRLLVAFWKVRLSVSVLGSRRRRLVVILVLGFDFDGLGGVDRLGIAAVAVEDKCQSGVCDVSSLRYQSITQNPLMHSCIRPSSLTRCACTNWRPPK